MGKYAQDTKVPAEQSRYEIERTLKRYGASSFAYADNSKEAMILFEAHERRIRFILPLPSREDFRTTETGKARNNQDAIASAHAQAIKQRWRALTLCIKAKLEAVETGISTFEEEFLANIVLPNGECVGDWLRPQIESTYHNGKMPPLLGFG